MIEARGSTDIARTIGEVFDYVVDARNEPKWLPGAKGVEKTTPGDVGLGTRFEGTYARRKGLAGARRVRAAAPLHVPGAREGRPVRRRCRALRTGREDAPRG